MRSSHHAPIQCTTHRDRRHSARGGGGVIQPAFAREPVVSTSGLRELPPVYGEAQSLDPYEVHGDFDPYPVPFDPQGPDYPEPGEDPYDPGPDNSGDGGSGEDPQCPILRIAKPAGCEADVPIPTGAEFGADQFQTGSALDRALVFTRSPNTAPSVAAIMRQALADHTAAFAQITIEAPTANGALMQSASAACEQQSQILDGFPQISPRPWQVEKDCMNVVGKLVAESGTPFLPWFVGWLEARNGIALSDFIPQTFLNWANPANSLRTKFNLVTEGAKCSAWWKEVKERGC